MGRMLDVLRQVEVERTDREPPPGAESPEQDFVSDSANEEVPFIEVGAARSLEASSVVLAVKPPHLRIAPPPPPEAASPAPGLGVCLRPLPGRLVLLPPAQRFAADLIAFHQPEHPVGAEYRQLAAALQEGAVPAQPHVLLCTGVSPGVGTTSVVLNLAICLADGGRQRVVVVDADEARPAVAERLGLRGRPGLAEVLAGSESLERALQDTGLPGLTALTAGRPEHDGSTGRVGDAGRLVLRLLRDRFDVVLIDGGSEPGGLGEACDGIYLVVAQAEADAPSTVDRVRTLLKQGAPLRGCIVTGR